MCWRFGESSEVYGFLGGQVVSGFSEVRHGRISHTEAGLTQKNLVCIPSHDLIMRKSFVNHQCQRNFSQSS